MKSFIDAGKPFGGKALMDHSDEQIKSITDHDEYFKAGELEGAKQQEVRVLNELTGGEKGSKPERYDLIPAAPLREVARLYAKGAEKYEERNWEKGYNWSLSYAAMMRHAQAFWGGGQSYDPETGTHHLAAVMFHAMALMQFDGIGVLATDHPVNGTLATRQRAYDALDYRPVAVDAVAVPK